MRAILSGQAGIALLGDDDAAFAVTIEAPEDRTRCSWAEAPYLFADAGDVVELPEVSEEDALEALEQAWRRDRALRLTLILLDREEDEETRRMAAECVEEHLASEEIGRHVANRLYSAPLPTSADLGRAKAVAVEAGANRFGDLLEQVGADQAVIARVRQAWDEIPSETFEVHVSKERFEAVAVETGAFRLMVEALDSGRVEQAETQCLDDTRVKRLQGHRDVMTAWANGLRPAKEDREPHGAPGGEYHVPWHHDADNVPPVVSTGGVYSELSSSTSTNLLECVQRGDETAWERMVSIYYPLVCYWCDRRGLQSHDCEDLAQDVFAVVAKHIVRFRKETQRDSFRAWLRLIVQSKLSDFWRQQKKQAKSIGGSEARRWLSEVPDTAGEEADGATSVDEEAVVVRAALEALSVEFEPRTWRAFWRVAVDGQPAAQVAEELDTSSNAVRLAKSRVLRRLREELEEWALDEQN